MIAVNAPPSVKDPSVVISGMLKIFIEIKIPIANAENPRPSRRAVR
jgi:hypothetical protein